MDANYKEIFHTKKFPNMTEASCSQSKNFCWIIFSVKINIKSIASCSIVKKKLFALSGNGRNPTTVQRLLTNSRQTQDSLFQAI